MVKHENIYQTANKLAEQIKASPEYARYMTAKERLLHDPINRKLLRDLRNKQFDLEDSLETDDEYTKQEEFLNDLMMSVALNPAVNDFLNAEYNFGRIIEQLSEIFEQIFPEDDIFEEEEAAAPQGDTPHDAAGREDTTYIN